MKREVVVLKKALQYSTLVHELKDVTSKYDKHDKSEHHTKFHFYDLEAKV